MSDKKDGLEEVIRSSYNNADINYDGLSNERKYFQDTAQAIRLWIKQNLPEEEPEGFDAGFNHCLAQVKKNLLEE
jgi:hypothetical protein